MTLASPETGLQLRFGKPAVGGRRPVSVGFCAPAIPYALFPPGFIHSCFELERHVP